MKYHWESCDIVCGRRVSAHNRTEEYLIGYDPRVGGPLKYALVSCADGMLARCAVTKEELVEHLNTNGMRPTSVELPDIHTYERP